MRRQGVSRVLHCAAEFFPLVKTGGLADVVAALPGAQRQLGVDARVVLPGFPAVTEALLHRELLVELGSVLGCGRLHIWRGELGSNRQPVYVVDAPFFYGRQGGPYQDAQGQDWPDNAPRFALLGWVAAQLASGALDPDWSAEVLHAHDWHSALSLVYLKAHPGAPVRGLFTIHNLAYQGLFPLSDHALLGLSSRWLTPQGLEFHGQLSFMKGGLNFADHITTVSPTYAKEILHPERGEGLQGVLRHRASHLTGILNGIDLEVWNPATDAHLPEGFDAHNLAGKSVCKQAVVQEAQLQPGDGPLMVCIGRMSTQKGLDLLLQSLPGLVEMGYRVILQGSGDPSLEAAVQEETRLLPGRVQAYVGYDEARAHRLMAAADVVAVPSRFEPCGLTQMYGMRYGALPLVRRTGGLADTVRDVSQLDDDDSLGPGFVFEPLTSHALLGAASRAKVEYDKLQSPWGAWVQRAMAQRHGWLEPAKHYQALYETSRPTHASATWQ